MDKLMKRIEINKDENKNLQCAACGYINDEIAFMKYSDNDDYKICPNCGTIKFISDITRSYIKISI